MGVGIINLLKYLIPSIPDWINFWISIILVILTCVLVIIKLIHSRGEDKFNRFKSAKPVLLSRFNTKINYENLSLCIPILLLTESDDFDSCLKKDLESINKDIKLYNNLAEAFVYDFNSKIISLIKLKLPIQHDDITMLSRPEKYHTKHLYYEIGQQLHSFDYHFKKYTPLGFNTPKIIDGDGITRWKADIGCNVLFASVNKKDIDEIEEEILKILDAATHSARFKELNKFFESVEDRYEIYKNEIKRVLLENGE